MKNLLKNGFFVTLLVIVLFLLGFMLNMLVDGGSTPPRDLIGIVLTPVQTGAKNLSESVTGFFDTFTEYKALQEENEGLKARVSELEDKLEAASLYEIENTRLKELLGLAEEHPEYHYVYADVVSVATGGFSSGFQINRGSASGLEKGDVVVTSEGLVGYVHSVNLNCADVVSILDERVSVGVRIGATGEMAMTEGTLELRTKGQLKMVFIPIDANIVRGDLIYTSGLNGTYPADLRVGTIASIETASNGLSQYAVLKPAADFSALHSVYIITDWGRGNGN